MVGRLCWLAVLVTFLAQGLSAQERHPHATRSSFATRQQLDDLLSYIRSGWQRLRRTHADILAAAVDPKSPTVSGRWPLYLSRRESVLAVKQKLRRETQPKLSINVELCVLPEKPTAIREQGLLYLPHPYVVPGGRFNEMYGWDSFFIVLGLLRDGEIELARQMTDNFVYEIRHYGTILNANRTYYLTRSQPPFLTGMLLRVFHRTKDRRWLADAWPAVERYYRYWTNPPHLVAETGLARYFDSGVGPAPEVLTGEIDARGRCHYDRIREYFRTHETTDYDVSRFYDRTRDKLTDLFFVADRSMRESGFDPSGRFGPFNAGVLDFNPVCLNSLLYLMEVEAEQISRILDRSSQSAVWKERARSRRERVNRLLWDEQIGLYLDRDFVRGTRRPYPFLTTFFPLWTGIASTAQAARVAANLPLFERPGGLQTSTQVTGNQWDSPYGWAPLHLITVQGLRRCGFDDAADRVSINFLSLILKEYLEHNGIFEKYDVLRRESSVEWGLRFGYASNEIGFGWTNAAFTELYQELSERRRNEVRWLSGIGVPDKVRDPSTRGKETRDDRP